MPEPVSFQDVILRFLRFWADQGCLVWQPYNIQVGAGTMNPATFLRVLGPEPWRVVYVEPSIRPDDGRYGENPNRMQQHTQLQVILKPDPGNPQELYLQSLEAVGIDLSRHDIRFVEDNWEAPPLGAWGLGWEVWLDGLEITQFTYFQQAGGINLDPVSVEITYGLDRIVMFLQGVHSVWEVTWDGGLSYGDVLRQNEVEQCRYNFDVAEVSRLAQMYDLYEAEAKNALAQGLIIPAYDYILKCSHTFNLLDSRGAIGVTERASYFRRMRDLASQVAAAYVEQRQRLGFPWLRHDSGRETLTPMVPSSVGTALAATSGEGVGGEEGDAPAPFVLEIGTEELPVGDLASALAQLKESVPALLADLRLAHGDIRVLGTPRRLAVMVADLAPRQADKEIVVKGPPAKVAFDAAGQPTRAAEGFARAQGVDLQALRVRDMDGGRYVVAVKRQPGRSATEVLAQALPGLIAGLRFAKTMRWNATNVAFSRPIRWLVALLGNQVIPFTYAGVASGRTSRGSRPSGSPDIVIHSAASYARQIAENGILLDPDERRARIATQVAALAAEVGGQVPEDPELLDEVTHLVEQPTALRGSFDAAYLRLPRDVLITVMKKHQRYFPIVKDGGLLPYFITVRNGDDSTLDIVRRGNEEVIRARFADAEYFYAHDTQQPLEAYIPRLETLTFQERLGSMRAKAERITALVAPLVAWLGLSEEERATAQRAAALCKADLVTRMVIEFTSLQGVMGREYARLSGEPEAVATAIFEHYLPRFAGDRLPETRPGLVVGLADRLDSLAGLFAVGLAPTGSADPYGLRRAALGLIQNLLAHRVSLDLRQALEEAARHLPLAVDPAALTQALEFIQGRLRGVLLEAGLRYDVVEAAIAERGADPYRAQEAAFQLSRWVTRPEWPALLAAYSRCVRITREETQLHPLDPARFQHPSEARLYQAYVACRAQVTPDSSVDAFFTAFMPLLEPITQYFIDVLVMHEDPDIRANRLGLLQRIAALPQGIVDLSKLEGF
jgi:glycyl-tRNA synthetase